MNDNGRDSIYSNTVYKYDCLQAFLVIYITQIFAHNLYIHVYIRLHLKLYILPGQCSEKYNISYLSTTV